METTLRPHSVGRRIAPLATGAALAGAAVYVAANDPAVAGFFPRCLFRQTTGLWCPGCGLTRGMHALLHGDVVAAVSSNVFTPVVAVLMIGGWWWWTLRAFGGTRSSPFARVTAPWWVAAVVAIVLYGVLRNVPAAPFDALAP